MIFFVAVLVIARWGDRQALSFVVRVMLSRLGSNSSSIGVLSEPVGVE